jgi:hypothetical protein
LFGRTLKTRLDVEILIERKRKEMEEKTNIRKNDKEVKMQMKQSVEKIRSQ